MEDLFEGIGRAFTESGGTTGWDALGTADTVIAGLAAGTALLLVLTMVPAAAGPRAGARALVGARDLRRVVVKLIDEPGANGLSEPRHGVLIALASAAVLVASAMTVAAAPQRHRRAPVKTYTPPPRAVLRARSQATGRRSITTELRRRL